MSEPHRLAISLDQENARLRARIDELEQELALQRQSFGAPDQRTASGPQTLSDQYYKEVFDHLSVCMFFVDVTLDGRFRYVAFNPAEEQVVGLSSAEVAGKFVEDVFAPDLAEKLSGNYRLCLEKGTAVTYDDELGLPAGSRYFHSNLIPLRDSSGRIHRIVGACTDITEQKVIEERLRRSESRLTGAQRLTKIGNWERDILSASGYWSDEMFRIYGLPAGATPSFPVFLNFVHAEDRQRLLDAHKRVESSDSPQDIEFRIVRPDGEVRYVRTILEAVRDDHGAVVRTVGATQDVTDLKRARDEAFARQTLESVGTLASGIAHDFNNLLGAVLAQTELAQAECGDGSDPDEQLKAIRMLAIRGSEIVRQLMIYAGKERQIHEHLDLSQVVEEMLALLRVSVSKHAVLETHLGKGFPPVRGSAAQLRQIVMNLVSNASEALGDQDGVIRVTTSSVRVDGGAATAEGVTEGEYLQLEISDTGSGMSRETQARVFDPFFTTKSSGRGLGLSVVDGIVRNFGGVIHLASHPGNGTTFRILLPCAQAAGMTVEPIAAVNDSRDQSRATTVLVVDDEDALRYAVAKMLRKSGCQVLEADNGTAALNMLRANGTRIDMVLLDMTMPGPSSHEVVAAATQTRPDLKVILTSAYTQEAAAANMTEPPIRGFLRKPFTIEDLVQTLRSALSS